MKKRIKKGIIACTVAITIMGNGAIGFASTYEVKNGDTYWKISDRLGVSLDKLLTANNAWQNDELRIGQMITVSDGSDCHYYEVKYGDTPWIISQKFGVLLSEFMELNNLNSYSYIYPGQILKIPLGEGIIKENGNQQPEVTYINHKIVSGDNFWSLGIKYGVLSQEIMKANNCTENTVLYVGQTLKIPVHNVPVLDTPGSKYGEYLDWWKGVQYVIPIGAVFKIKDFYTGKTFTAKRTAGSFHADVETLTKEDTRIMKSIWGGTFNWVRRPVIIIYNGRQIAASASGMPHAGNEAGDGGSYTSWRSGDYGAGTNYDYVKGNDMNGHFDIHFLNSIRHKDSQIDSQHQSCVKIAAGVIK